MAVAGRRMAGNAAQGYRTGLIQPSRCTALRNVTLYAVVHSTLRSTHAHTAYPVGATEGLAERAKQQRAPPTGSILTSLSFAGPPPSPRP